MTAPAAPGLAVCTAGRVGGGRAGLGFSVWSAAAMTDRIEHLRALHDAVKAGGYPDRQTEVAAFYLGGSISDCNERATFARAANAGSLDAALALHEAVLPGWVWNIDAGDGAYVENRGDFGDVFACDLPGQLARSWLLAILSALIAMEEGK